MKRNGFVNSGKTCTIEGTIKKDICVVSNENLRGEDMKMKYRKLSMDEAEQFWSLMNQLDYETKYMLYEPGERTKNLSIIESSCFNLSINFPFYFPSIFIRLLKSLLHQRLWQIPY